MFENSLFPWTLRKREGILWINSIFEGKKIYSVQSTIKSHYTSVIKPVEIFSITNCELAQRYLMSGKFKPTGAILDIRIPQKNWGKKLIEESGIYFAQSLKAQYGEKFPLAFFITDSQVQLYREKIEKTGIENIFSMQQMGLVKVVNALMN